MLGSISARALVFQRDLQFQGDVLTALDVPENKSRITVNLPNGAPVTIIPGDINLSGSTIQLAQGSAALTATGNVNIGAATEDHSSSLDETHGYTALGSGKQTSNQRASQAEFSYGSAISADSVTINSGKDLTVTGSNVVGTNDVTLAAAGKVTINTSQDTQSSQTATHSHEFGMLSGSDLVNTLDGGLKGVSIGTRSMTDNQQTTQVTNNASMVGAVNGNLTVIAGDALHVTGSTVYAGNDASFIGKSVSFDSAFNTMTQSQQQSTSQTAVSGGLTSPIITAIQTVQAMEKASKDSGDPRLQAMAAATSAMAVANAYSAVSNAALGSAVGVSISLGTSQSNNQSTSTLSQAIGSSASAGNNLSVTATGAGASSNIDVIGSSLRATNNTTIAADGTVNLLAAKNTTTQQSTNDGASASIGVTFGLGASNGVSFQLGVSANKGDGNGNDVVYTNTQVSGGNKVALISGSDTNLIGAVVSAPQVVASVGGNLNIQSLQDTSTYDSKQTSAGIGVSLCIPPICYGSSSVSGNFSNAKVNGDYASVTTQSGIQAGDQGFQVGVAGNTNLTGAVIASSNQAIVDNQNILMTGTLTQSSLQNKDTFDASGFSIAASVSGKVGDQSAAKPGPQKTAADAQSTPTGSSGFSSNSGSQASTAQSGISGGLIIITDNAAQIATGQTADQTVASVNRNIVTGADTSGALTKAWNGDQLMQQTQVAVQISAAFGSTVAKTIGKYADDKYQQAVLDGDAETAAQWQEGGTSRVALQTAAAALGGGLNGALASVVSTEIMPKIGDMINQMNLPAPIQQALGMIASSAIGTIVGGGVGASTSFNIDVNNRQLDNSDKVIAKALASKSDGQYTQAQIENALRSANNKQLGETASTGAVVPYDAGALFHVSDSTGMIFGLAPDGTYVLMQNPAMLVPPDSNLQAFIKNNTGDVYSWNSAAPQLSAIPLSALPSIMNGTVTPEMLASRQNNAADISSWVSTQSGRVGSAATAYASYLASQPNAASQAGAAIQLGIAGTATIVGYGASALEQLLRPNSGSLTTDVISTAISATSNAIPGYGKLIAPVVNEASEAAKQTSWSVYFQNWINKGLK